MAAIEFAGFVYTGAGVAVENATVNLYDRNTTTPVRATTTTNSSGYWTISHATEGRFDVEIVDGTTSRRIKYDSAIQLQEVETANLLLRNPGNTFKYDIVPGAILADRTLNVPVITGTDTLAVLGLAQTFSAIKTFSAIPVMSGGAVGFPATQVASAVANDLDDYEEGTWTPVVGGTATYTTQIGRYIKIGKQVWVACDLLINVLGTGSTTVVSGLPFAAVNASINFASPVQYFSGIATASTWLTGYVNGNAATVGFVNTIAAVTTARTDPVFGDTARVVWAAVYEAAA